ncbi:hypothetical protein V7S43_018039 [Phytophthora oleae]|uniref:TauD/TfdA-like domain-containing protein n=1 Tax=Phytophthora oleae TaxID=2107226 RepID=A0ABD3EVE4_9STRA
MATKPIKNALNLEVEHAPFTHPELLGEFPTKTYDPIPVLPYEDRALKADPTFKNLLADATVTHLEPKIGTEISGLQLHELTDAQKDELALLIAHRGVVFFRDQKLSIEEQLALGRYYGPLHVHQTVTHSKGIPQVHVVENSLEGSQKRIESQLYEHVNVWHSDVSYERQPPSYTSFKVLTTPPTGGDTLWASAYDAYDRLTPHFKKFAEGLTAIHSSKHQAEAALAHGLTLRRPIVEFEHPVVQRINLFFLVILVGWVNYSELFELILNVILDLKVKCFFVSDCSEPPEEFEPQPSQVGELRGSSPLNHQEAQKFEHPVVRTHPVTGRKALFVNDRFTTRIKNLSVAEAGPVFVFAAENWTLHLLVSCSLILRRGAALPDQAHCGGPRIPSSLPLDKGAVAIWDNRATIHYATYDYLTGNRHAVRVTPHDEIPYFESDENP